MQIYTKMYADRWISSYVFHNIEWHYVKYIKEIYQN